jgi:hypothetical protein
LVSHVEGGTWMVFEKSIEKDIWLQKGGRQIVEKIA